MKSINQENDGQEEEQILGLLKQAEPGMSIKELCRQDGFSDVRLCKYRAKSGGVQPTDAERLRKMESENSKLKRLLTEPRLDIHSLNDVFGVKPQPRRPDAQQPAR